MRCCGCMSTLCMRELPFSSLSIQPILRVIEETFPPSSISSSSHPSLPNLSSSRRPFSSVPSPSVSVLPSSTSHLPSPLPPNIFPSSTHPSSSAVTTLTSSSTHPSSSVASRHPPSSTLTSSSIVAMIIECSKLEMKKSKKGKASECLSLYISDPSYHLFKINYYGTDALQLLSQISVGDILLINNFHLRLQSSSHGIYFGVAEYQTITFILRYATGEYQFNTKLYPKIHSMIQTLVSWAKQNFPLHFQQLASATTPQSSNPVEMTISTPQSLIDIPASALWIDIVLCYHHAVMSSDDPNQFQKHWILSDRCHLQVLLKFPSYQVSSTAATDLNRCNLASSPVIFCKNVLIVRDRSRSVIR